MKPKYFSDFLCHPTTLLERGFFDQKILEKIEGMLQTFDCTKISRLKYIAYYSYTIQTFTRFKIQFSMSKRHMNLGSGLFGLNYSKFLIQNCRKFHHMEIIV